MVEEVAAELAKLRAESLAGWDLGLADVQAFNRRVNVRILPPGSTAGEPMHVLSSLEHLKP